jgi:nitrite reductase (NADH) small subunit
MLTLGRIALCQLDELPVGLGRAFEVDGQPLAVFRTRAGRIFAVDGICPHKGGPLADGMLAGDSVVCPYHAFRFEGATGACDQAGVCDISTYPVEVTDDGVFVTI